MFKKVWLLMLAFLLVLSPVLVSADTNETDNNQSEEANDTQGETDQTDADTTDTDEEDEEGEEPAKEDTNTSEAKSEDEATEEDPESENNSEEENADEDARDQDTNTEEDSTTETDQADAEDAEADDQVNEEEATAGKNEEDTEEELNLKEIMGTANANGEIGGITYDFNKGYYVMHLQAGLTNWTNTQDVNKMWVAFALPNGVSIPDVENVPSGILPVALKDGGAGIAVKVPDIKGIGDENVYLDIPLQGVPDDNDPNNNLYLFEADGNGGTFEEIGQIRSQRDIDFSVMEANPQLDLHGSIAGEATFNNDKGHYMLDVTVKAQNQTDSNVNDLYAGFALPEGVKVLQNEDTPANIQPLALDNGSEELAVKLPNLATDEEKEINYQIPVIGVSDEVIEDSTINVYKINSPYQQVGQFEGSINVDFSKMTEQWDFGAKAQIVKDYPGLENGQFGLNFAFNASNLTIDDVDKVKVEFNVPEDITVHEPDEYTQGDAPDALKDFLDDNSANENLDIEWVGNTAIINLDTVNGASGYEGFFSAFGESSKALQELKGTNVLVTLYQNGNETVKEINVPFEIVSHEGEGEEPGDDDDNDDDEESGKAPGKDENGNNDNSGNNGSDNDNNNNNKGSDNNKGTNNDDGTNGDNKDKDDVHLEIGSKNGGADENDDDATNISSINDSGSDGWELPNTATNMFTFMLIGSILAIAGGALMLFRRRKLAQE